MSEEKKCYKPGFFCALFWLLTWIGMAAGVIVFFLTLENALPIALWLWGGAAVSAIISYIIRTVEKSNHDGRWSWHWFD